MIDLPPDYIDPEHTGRDREMLEAFYKACRSEGGTADEITLRGLKAVLALAQPEPADLSGVSWPDSGPITARAVFADGTCYLLDTQPEPEPEGPTASDVTELFYRHMGEGSEVGFENAIAEALARWGRPAIQPVPVAERLPGPEDVDWLDICKGMLHDFDDLVANSDGVLGLHHNGDLATWDELTEGSDFLWTGQFARAREAIDALPVPCAEVG